MIYFAVVLGKLEVGLLEAGHFMSLVRGAQLAFLVGAELEEGAKFREAGSYGPSPDHFWSIAAGVVRQSSVFIHALASVPLYIQSQPQNF